MDIYFFICQHLDLVILLFHIISSIIQSIYFTILQSLLQVELSYILANTERIKILVADYLISEDYIPIVEPEPEPQNRESTETECEI